MSKDKIIIIGGKGSAIVIAEQIYDSSVKLQGGGMSLSASHSMMRHITRK